MISFNLKNKKKLPDSYNMAKGQWYLPELGDKESCHGFLENENEKFLKKIWGKMKEEDLHKVLYHPC